MKTGFDINDEALKEGARIFNLECTFVAGVQNMDAMFYGQLPAIAFAGRSNVGKSTLINTLTGRRALARASQTPGRTQQINFFNLGDELHLVDLPGYGYAKVSRSKVEAWTKMIHTYFQQCPNLRRVCVLLDSRHGVKPPDLETMKLLDEARVPWLAVMTKCDKAKKTELDKSRAMVEDELKKHPGAFPVAYETSSTTKEGIAELRAIMTLM